MVIWIVGMPNAGKTTIATSLFVMLATTGHKVELLDGNAVRRFLGGDFTKEGRYAQIKRIRYICKILRKHGIIPIVAAITPYEEWRAENRRELEGYFEIYMQASLTECIKRDDKDLYQRALDGELENMTGVNDPFEEPYNPDLICYTELEKVEDSIDKVYKEVRDALRKTSGKTGLRCYS